MKRLTATNVVLGVLVIAFLIPVALLMVGALALILNYCASGIGAGVSGLSFSLSRRAFQTTFLIIILMLATFISWLTQKILRRQKSRR
ncbi:MAG: hypothetical protein M3R68_07530 [Acidobacteriota bacterium]|nr:hypothetical protein [Acidobacteriota bacterium]